MKRIRRWVWFEIMFSDFRLYRRWYGGRWVKIGFEDLRTGHSHYFWQPVPSGPAGDYWLSESRDVVKVEEYQ